MPLLDAVRLAEVFSVFVVARLLRSPCALVWQDSSGLCLLWFLQVTRAAAGNLSCFPEGGAVDPVCGFSHALPHSVACCLSGPLSAGARFPPRTVGARSPGRVGGGVGLALGALGEPTDLVGRTPVCDALRPVGGLPAECNQQDGCPLSASLPVSSVPPAMEVSPQSFGCCWRRMGLSRPVVFPCRRAVWSWEFLFRPLLLLPTFFIFSSRMSCCYLPPRKAGLLQILSHAWVSAQVSTHQCLPPTVARGGLGGLVGSPGSATHAEVCPPLTGRTGR